MQKDVAAILLYNYSLINSEFAYTSNVIISVTFFIHSIVMRVRGCVLFSLAELARTVKLSIIIPKMDPGSIRIRRLVCSTKTICYRTLPGTISNINGSPNSRLIRETDIIESANFHLLAQTCPGIVPILDIIVYCHVEGGLVLSSLGFVW